MQKLYKSAKVLFVLSLLVCFIYWQALGMINKFLAGEVITNVAKEKENYDAPGILPPATTFCMSDPSLAGFWKIKLQLQGYKDIFAGISSSCTEANVSDTLDCVDNNTYSLQETVHHTMHNLSDFFVNGINDSLMSPQYWLSDVTLTKFGKCHTFQFPSKVNADMKTGAIMFGLFPGKDYKIFFHDPKYFAQASNPLVYPKVWWEKPNSPNQTMEWLYLNMVKHKKLSREEEPCNEDPNYNYMTCIKNSNAKSIGCRPGWEKRSNFNEFSVCKTLEDLKKHEARDHIVFNAEKKLVTSSTGCLMPCTFREYSITGEPQKASIESVFGNNANLLNLYWLGYNMATTEVEVYEEQLLYPLISFVAEFGGSLGLFLGASFISVWDLVDWLLSKANQYYSQTYT